MPIWIEIVSGDLSKQSFRLEAYFDNGSTSKMRLGRRNSVPSDIRAKSLYCSLGFFGERIPVEIVISPEQGSITSGVSLLRIE